MREQPDKTVPLEKSSMNKNFLKVMAGLSMVLAGATPVFAANSPTIDASATGSIQVIKLHEQNGVTGNGTGIVNPSENRDKISGVKFKVAKVADITGVVDDQSDTVGTYYSNLNSTIKAQAAENKTNYTADEVQAALAKVNSTSQGLTAIRGLAGTEKTTDGNGSALFDDLDLGLYVVSETDASGAYIDGNSNGTKDAGEEITISALANPYLVSVPMTAIVADGSDAAGTYWQYDVVTYPKNASLAVHKSTLDLDNKSGATTPLAGAEDYEIGRNFEQVIYSDLPKNAEHDYTKVVISDTMKNSAFAGVTKVVLADTSVQNIENAEITGTTLEAGDYTVSGSEGDATFTVTLTAAGLQKVNALQKSNVIVVYFNSYLTADAVIGSASDNSNTATITWNNGGAGDSSVNTNTVKHYTYGVTFNKTGLTDATRAVFTVKRNGIQGGAVSADNETVSFIKESEGTYRIARTGEGSSVTEISPASDGHVTIRGLDDNYTYTFTEIATESGKNLMAKPFTVRLTANSPEDGKLKSATVTSGDYDYAVAGNNVAISVSDGMATFEVENAPTVTLRTGGSGLFMVAGIAAVAAVAAVIFKKASAKA